VKILLYIIVLLSLFITLSAQRGGIQGKITEDDDPLPGVNVFLLQTNFGGVSDPGGFYKIKSIPPGTYSIRYSAVGYKTQVIEVDIAANKILEVDVEMEIEVIEVAEVQVVDKDLQKQSDTRVSLINLQPDKARVLPGAVTDVFRTLQALPGVLAPNDFSSQLVIRGSGPDQNLIVMDDVEIFNPYRLYGVISMFNPEAVDDINLITGGFPSVYGDRLSAVLDVTNRQGSNSKGIAGNINASIVSANLVLEGKNPFNVPGSWLINSRRTYYDLIVEPIVKNAGLVEDNVTFPNFYDIQAKLAFGPFKGHKFFINGIYSRDGVDLVSSKERNNPDSVGVFNITRNDVISFAWHFAPTSNLLNKVVLSWYENSGDTDFDSKVLDPSLNRDDFEDTQADTLSPYLVGFKFDSEFKFKKYAVDNKFVHFWGERNELQAGLGVDFLTTDLIFNFQLDPQLRSFLNSNPNIRATLEDLNDSQSYNRYKGYVSNNFALTERLFIEPGVRFDYYEIIDKGYFSPRLSLSFAVDEITTLRGVWGVYYQSPGYEKLRDRGVLYDFSPQYTEKLKAEATV